MVVYDVVWFKLKVRSSLKHGILGGNGAVRVNLRVGAQ
jgi:hypothetical protein